MYGIKSQAVVERRRTESAGDEDPSEAVFAIKNIHRGMRIAAEVPLVVVPPVPDEKELSEFIKVVDSLPEDKATEIAKLFCQPSIAKKIEDDNYVSREVWRFYKTKKRTDGEEHPLQGKKLQKAIKKTVNLCAIYFTNNVQLGPGGKYGSGVFSLYSRIAHSCVPNAYNSWNPTIEQLTIHATHDIKAGDQIYVDYVGHACWTRQQRSFALVTKWNITCNCAACTKPWIDGLRHRMLVLDQALAAYTCGASRDPDFSAVHNIPRIVTAKEALKAAEELVRLLKRQKLYGMELCRVFRECSQYALRSNLPKEAIEYAYKELEVERALVGKDTGHLREGLCGAKYWVEHIRKETKL